MLISNPSANMTNFNLDYIFLKEIEQKNLICQMIPHKFSLFLPLILLGFTINSEAQPTYTYSICTNTTTFTGNSTYQANVNNLLSQLSTSAVRLNGLYTSSSGKDPDVVYGLSLCFGDISSDICQNCVTNATKDIVGRCPIGKEAMVWYDECFLRYSSQPILSILALYPAVSMMIAQNATDPERFNELLKKTMNETANEAASAPSGAKKFEVKETNFTTFQKIYTLAQCTPDLSGFDCLRCLQFAISNLPLQGKQGGRILLPSCNIRYENDPFYNETGFQREIYPNYNTTVVTGGPPPAPGSTTRTEGGKGGQKNQIKVIASTSAVVVVLVLFGSSIYAIRRRNILKKEEKEISQEVQLLHLGIGRIGVDPLSKSTREEEMLMNSQDFPMIPFNIVYEATKHFSDETKLGQGGFGPVYKGTLEDGKEVAVKRLSSTSSQGLHEFMNEVTLIARLQHRNLVRLLGCCLEKNEKLLIYEYMPNKSLDFFIFDSNTGLNFDWEKRLCIINGVAKGLLYLHEDSRLRIIHRDLKASNVLLDYEMNPKISDFGMARIFRGNDNNSTNRIVGTYGYMSPEYAMEGLFSVKSDVFSFGVLLLEMISGRRNSRFYISEEGESLITYAWKLWSKSEGLELMDQSLTRSSVAAEVLKCIHIGLLCVQDDPAERPTMSSVVVMLASDTLTLPQPKQPAFSIWQFVAGPAPFSSPKICSVNQLTLSNVLPR
ncbi:cysteine-rich receptor-like protein kinase 15 isoform X2 [Hevea brasiliensis]|uniref:cysteine-rich receptor-like protein kinase 15 isoform X2 n=1 Tax=Hevea brasiliensis TaxID=3981 RepID=UPI0025F6892D|nr:cysteine-rich receptor-like protein kinase 15 isoform X2 [Hevea brasiliensis]